MTSVARDMSGNVKATYKWSADGAKTGVADNTGAGLEYLGSLIYKRNGSSLELEGTSFGGGRITKASGAYEVNYFITDHIGSTRVVARPGSGGIEVAERNNFFGFGAKHPDPTWTNPVSGTNRFRFSGKEEQDVFGLPYNDHGARIYDAPLGRWWSMDILAEKYWPETPFMYAGNNPVKYIDPDGKKRRLIIDNQNQTITIQATYYHIPAHRQSLTAALKVINQMNNYTHTDQNGLEYKIIFNLSTKEAGDPGGKSRKDDIGNYFYTENRVNERGHGGEAGYYGAAMSPKYINDIWVIIHELAHTLGVMLHSKEGYMVYMIGGPGAGNYFIQENIDEMINNNNFGPVEVKESKKSKESKEKQENEESEFDKMWQSYEEWKKKQSQW